MKRSKAEHVLYGRLFVVEMYRWDNTYDKAHHYTAGIFDNEADAKACGGAEYIWRGSIYEPIIYKHDLNTWRNGTRDQMIKEFTNTYKEQGTVEEFYEKIRIKK